LELLLSIHSEHENAFPPLLPNKTKTDTPTKKRTKPNNGVIF